LLQKLDSLPTPQSPDEIFMEQYQGGHKGIDNILPSPDGKYILSSASPRSIEASNSIQVWDAKNGKRILDFARHVTKGYSPNHGVAAMLFLSDLKTVLTAAGDNVIRLWDVPSGNQVLDIDQGKRSSKDDSQSPVEKQVTSLAISRDKRIAVSGGYWNLHLWDLTNGAELKKFQAHYMIEGVAITPDGRTIATGSKDGIIRIWDAASGVMIAENGGHQGPINALTYYKDGRFLISASEDGTVRFWDGKTGALRATLISFNDGQWAVVEPDGRFDTQSLDRGVPMRWVIDSEPLRALPIEIFMRQYYTPRLLPRILNGEQLPVLPCIAEINRVQPLVSALHVEPMPGKYGFVRVHLHVEQQMQHGQDSGARDLHIFLNGQLVVPREGTIHSGDYTFDDIRLSDAKVVKFSSYLFNQLKVKSETIFASYENHQPAPQQKPRTFVLTVGVSAVRDAG
jgi:hypothetical protein